MVPMGRVCDVFRRKRALLTGIVLFGAASALCVLSPSAEAMVLVIARTSNAPESPGA